MCFGRLSTATVLVNPHTYPPVQIAFRHLSGVPANLGTPYFAPSGTLTIIERFTAFERLPATTGNPRLTSLSARHPSAHRVVVTSLFGR